MSSIHFIKTPEKRDIIAQLEEQFGIAEFNYLLVETGKDKIRGYSGSMSKDEILQLAEIANIEGIGVYLLRRESDGFRLSFDAAHLLGKQITKNIIEINESQLALWIRGYDIDVKAEAGWVVVKYENDFIGCGKSTGEKIINHVPKERRLRNALPEKQQI